MEDKREIEAREVEPNCMMVGNQTTLEVKKVANLIKSDVVEQNEVELE